MATPVFCCGAECGVFATTGAHWENSNASTFSTSTFNNGLRSVRVNPTAAVGNAQTNLGRADTVGVARAYINIASSPIVSSSVFGFVNATNGGLVYDTVSGQYFAGFDDGTTVTKGASGTTIGAGWHYIDIKVDVSANPRLADVQVDGVALGQASLAVAAGTVSELVLGNAPRGLSTFDIYYDDVILSATGADYPIGTGAVFASVPDADGTHTSTGTTTREGTIADPTGGANITSATTDAFNWVNGTPLLGGATDNTRLINCVTAASTTYCEVNFQASTGSVAPRAVEVITALRQAATQNGDSTVKLNDNGTENTIIAKTGAGSTSDLYYTKQYATMVGGGDWTQARFDALKVRYGYSADATPDQYWRGVMIEAEYPPGSTGGPTLLYPRNQLMMMGVGR